MGDRFFGNGWSSGRTKLETNVWERVVVIKHSGPEL